MHRAHSALQRCPHSEVPQILSSILLFSSTLYPICFLYSPSFYVGSLSPPFSFSGSVILLALHLIFSIYLYRIGRYVLFSLKSSPSSCSLTVYSHSSLSLLLSECVALFVCSFSLWPNSLKQFLQARLPFSPFLPLLLIILYIHCISLALLLSFSSGSNDSCTARSFYINMN